MNESMQDAAGKLRAVSAVLDRLAVEHPDLPLSWAQASRDALSIQLHTDRPLDDLAAWSRIADMQAAGGYDYVSCGQNVTSHRLTGTLDGVALEVVAYVIHGPAADGGESA